MDEPTKGFDAEFKVTFAGIIDKLTKQGVTVLTVSHDVPFCAEYAHRCGMFFDGNIVAEGTPREFFSGNSFYTTPANRMARHLIPNAVTVEDIVTCCDGKLVHKQEDLGESITFARSSTEKRKFQTTTLKALAKDTCAFGTCGIRRISLCNGHIRFICTREFFGYQF